MAELHAQDRRWTLVMTTMNRTSFSFERHLWPSLDWKLSQKSETQPHVTGATRHIMVDVWSYFLRWKINLNRCFEYSLYPSEMNVVHAGQDCVAVVDPADDQCIHQSDCGVHSECSCDLTQLPQPSRNIGQYGDWHGRQMTVLGRW